MAGAYSEPKEKLRHVANVVSVYVRPVYRQQGLGKKLLEAVLDHIKTQPQIKKIQLGVITTQLEAYRLYQSLGFKKVGELRKSVRVLEDFYDEYLMEIILWSGRRFLFYFHFSSSLFFFVFICCPTFLCLTITTNWIMC